MIGTIPAVLSAACLVGLQADILDLERTVKCIHACWKLICSFEANNLITSVQPASELMCVAIASLINKAPDSNDLAMSISNFVEVCLVSSLEQGSEQLSQTSALCLGWVLRALGMRSNLQDVEAYVQEVILGSIESGRGSGSQLRLMLLATRSQDAVCSLDESMHPKSMRLWRQRLFSTCFSAVMQKIEDHQSDSDKEHRFLFALGHLLDGAGKGSW